MTFRLTEARQEWAALFPELSKKAIGKCILAEKREYDGDHKTAEKNLNDAIAIQEEEE